MNILALVIAVLTAIVAGVYFRQYLIDSMSNVRVAQEAQEYLQRDSVNITNMLDTYLYTNISVVPKPHRDEETPDDNVDGNVGDSDNDSDDSGGSDSDGD